MAKCIACNSVYADQLRRCPYCGESPDAGPRPQPAVSRRRAGQPAASRAPAMRLWLVSALLGIAAIAGLVLTVGLPSHDVPVSTGDEEPREVPRPPPDLEPPTLLREIEPGKVAEGFAIEGARPYRGRVLAEGRCSPEAIARVVVNGTVATLRPDATAWSAVVDAEDGAVVAVAEGVAGDRAELRAVVARPAAPEPWRLVSHAEGATLRARKLGLQFESLKAPGTTGLEEAFLDHVENRVRWNGGTFTLYRAPEGLVFLRVTSQGTLSFLREADDQEMVLVPAGLSRRGMGKTPPHGPAHVVRMGAFLIDRTEVTCRQYAAFLRYMRRTKDEAYRHTDDQGIDFRPDGWTSDDPPQGLADHPVTGVDWYCAYAYARWVGGDLPVEAEWERAAAGPLGLAHPWGATFDPGRCHHAAAGPVPAVGYPQGVSPYGLLHAIGNVREWCGDRYDPRWYKQGSRTHPRGPSRNEHRVIRGGSFRSPREELDTRFRSQADPVVRADDLGFRVVLRWDGFAHDVPREAADTKGGDGPKPAKGGRAGRRR